MRGMLQGLSWLEIVQLDPPLSPLAVWRLGCGESEVIECARLNPVAAALLDDRAARKLAVALGMPVYGTLSIIAKWVSLDLSRSFEDTISLLYKAGLYLDERTIETVWNRLGAPT